MSISFSEYSYHAVSSAAICRILHGLNSCSCYALSEAAYYLDTRSTADLLRAYRVHSNAIIDDYGFSNSPEWDAAVTPAAQEKYRLEMLYYFNMAQCSMDGVA